MYAQEQPERAGTVGRIPRSPGPARGTAGVPAGAAAAGILSLQRTAGNAAVARAIEVQRSVSGACGASCGHQDKPSAPVQRRMESGLDAPEVSVHDVLRTSGTPLQKPVQRRMEAGFGVPEGAFSDVQLHTGADGLAAARSVGATAFTSGNHIVGDVSDPHTLAHELHHKRQQERGPVAGTDNGRGLSVSDPSDRFEQEAERVADQVMSGTAARTETQETGAA